MSYNDKHNAANGEQNQDGHNHNFSYNFGEEGASNNPIILDKRNHARRALLATLLLSAGTPMLLAGDEMGNSQQGNNNSYCQDNEISWLDWQNADHSLIDYTANLIALRKQIPLLSRYHKWWDNELVSWLSTNGTPLQQADWNNNQIKAIQILLEDKWLLLINAKQSMQQFLLPKGKWQILLGKENTTLLTDTLAVALKDIGVCVLQKN